LFLNDVDTFLENKNITGLQTISDEIENNLDIYLKLFMNSTKNLIEPKLSNGK
jgi:hypothetical protein